MKSIVAAVAGGLVLSSAFARAQSLNFDFTFNGSTGNTVTGEIFGLQDNANSDPTDVVILSASAEDAVIDPDFILPFDFAANGGSQFGDGYFTVANGVITGISGGSSQNGYTITTGNVTLSLADGSTNSLEGPGFFRDIPGNPPYIASNNGGFAGVTYTADTTDAVPEPATWALLLTGAAALAAHQLRRRKCA